jgi:hypothetical protein
VGIRPADSLEIDEDPAFAERSGMVQRVGWIAVAAVLVGALAGLLGPGPLGRHVVSLPGLLRVEYERFARYEATQALTVRLEAGATRTPEVRLWLDRPYVEGTRLENIIPTPVRVEAATDHLVYVFRLSQPGDPVTITFRMQSEQIGSTMGRIGLVGAEGGAVFRQFVYP